MPSSKKKRSNGKKTRYMSRKREQELKSLEMARKVFADHQQKKKKLAKLRRKCKRKAFNDMMNLLSPFMHNDKFIREPAEWKSKSYNLERQINDFVNFIYCLYNPPVFMYEIFNDVKRINANFGRIGLNDDTRKHFKWFLTIAGGGSFAKIMKGTLTKKEAHLFLNAPKNNTIKENLWYARCKAEGLDEKLTVAFVKRFLTGRDLAFGSAFWHDFIRLVKREEDEANVGIVSDVVDFLRARHRQDIYWSLKGRTLSSLIKHSNQWHRQMQMKRFGSQNLRWKGVDIPDWSWKDKQNKRTWWIVQLMSSKELFAEGRKMRHCVASYGHRCFDGLSAIFTMTSGYDGLPQDEKHLTIEVSKDKRFVQAKAKMNRGPSGMESTVLNKWMKIHNIKERQSYY